MKKFRYIIAAVLVVAIGTTIFFGCEKENNNSFEKNIIKSQKSFDYGNPEQYGILHNEIANFIINNQPELLFLPNTIEKFDGIFSLTRTYLIDNDYFPEVEVDDAINMVREYYTSFGINETGELNYFILRKDTSFIREEFENFGYSPMLIDHLVIVYQQSLDTNTSYSTINSYLVNTMGTYNYGEINNNFRDRLIEVYEYSDQFWDTLDCYALPPSPELLAAYAYCDALKMQQHIQWQERRMRDASDPFDFTPASVIAGISNSYAMSTIY